MPSSLEMTFRCTREVFYGARDEHPSRSIGKCSQCMGTNVSLWEVCGGGVVSSLMAEKTLMTMSSWGGLAPRSHRTTLPAWMHWWKRIGVCTWRSFPRSLAHGHLGPQEVKEEVEPGWAYGNDEQELLETTALFRAIADRKCKVRKIVDAACSCDLLVSS
jgi:hypothetical protein